MTLGIVACMITPLKTFVLQICGTFITVSALHELQDYC